MNNNDKDYFLATKIGKGISANDFLVYLSEPFKFSEIDIINLIKICIIEGRSKYLGRKILSIYRDSNEDRKELINDKLKMIGVETDGEPEIKRKPKTK